MALPVNLDSSEDFITDTPPAQPQRRQWKKAYGETEDLKVTKNSDKIHLRGSLLAET